MLFFRLFFYVFAFNALTFTEMMPFLPNVTTTGTFADFGRSFIDEALKFSKAIGFQPNDDDTYPYWQFLYPIFPQENCGLT